MNSMAMDKLVFALVCVLCLPAFSESSMNYYSSDDCKTLTF